MLPTASLSALALSILLLPSSARVIWVPEDFDPRAGDTLLEARGTATCGGDKSLTYCGSAFPLDFCCSSGTTCLALNTIASVQATICCPDGQDCATINPVSCELSAQNTTNTQLHVNPPQQLNTCGSACCPMGYNCSNGQCFARNAPTPASETSPKSTSSSTSTVSQTSTTSTNSATASVTPGFGAARTRAGAGIDSDFNGKSFAAGFVPGLAIGAFIAACLILLCIRKRRISSETYVEEKRYNRDTLTDLGTLDRRPTMHGRSISEPKADPSTGYRTDFLRHSPPRGDGDAVGYAVNIRSSPATPSDSPPRIKALFSRSPFMSQAPDTPPSTQAPVSAHLKRGTLSFKISPVRALKKQKSTHSLRRQMTEASNVGRNNSRRPTNQHLSRSASTETIQVLMPSNEPYTPDRPPQIPESVETLSSTTYQLPKSATGTWNSSTTGMTDTPDERQHPGSQTPYASSSRYPSNVEPLHTTPTRPPIPRLPGATSKNEPFGFLGSPYTPTRDVGGMRSKGGLAPPGRDNRRDTTFSAMMEKAGLRKSDLMVGKGSRR